MTGLVVLKRYHRVSDGLTDGRMNIQTYRQNRYISVALCIAVLCWRATTMMNALK